MFSKIYSGAIYGVDSYLTSVEVDTAQALPGFDMVGFLSNEVKESRERVKVALKNIGISLPPMRITVNISPANRKKAGSAFDLPIAIGILISIGMIPIAETENTVVIGELGLDGEIKLIQGVLPIVLEAKRQGMKRCLVPVENAKEGAVVEGIEVIGVCSLRQALVYLQTPECQKNNFLKPLKVDIEKLFQQGQKENEVDFSEINGQRIVKRAVEIAAAGFHNLLMIGPPGSGKTMIAKRISTILPPLSVEESLEVSKIYSVSGLLNPQESLITKRPFLNPHHTISVQALSGGGRVPRPGVMSLAHRGVLFLDELPEFKRDTIEILRQPMEDRQINIARSYGTFTYPANFILVGAMNPCPCGYYPDLNHCICKEYEIQRYLKKISGPILDRFDLCVEATRVKIDDLTIHPKNETSEEIRSRVIEARKRQEMRFKGSIYHFNSEIKPKDMEKYCFLRKPQQIWLKEIFQTLQLSARAYHRIIKVARTIADIDGKDYILENHLSEAVCMRTTEQSYWMGGKHD